MAVAQLPNVDPVVAEGGRASHYLRGRGGKPRDGVLPHYRVPRLCPLSRRRLATADLPPELQDHTANALRVVAAKFRGDANSNVATCWAPSVRGAAALWRTCFACSVAKIAPAVAVPALFMCATQTLLEAFRAALSKLWLEMQEQFATKSSKYRGLKSRPPWSTMDAIYMECFSQRAGFGIKKDSAAASAKGATATA